MVKPTEALEPPTHYEQLLAAQETARYMAGLIAPEDAPRETEQCTRGAFPAAGLPDVVGVVLHRVPGVEALARIQVLFGGDIVRTRRAGTDVGAAWTEHVLVGTVRGVPYLAITTTDYEPLPMAPRRSGRSTARDRARGRAAVTVVADTVVPQWRPADEQSEGQVQS